MPFVRFQNLDVYRLAEKLGDSVWNLVRKWDGLARDTVGKQLIRAADSVGANIAEGSGRHSRNDNRRFVRIARGSLLETQHWLRRAFSRNLLTPAQTAALRVVVEQLAPTLNAYLKSLGRSPGTSRHAASPKHRPQTPNTKH
jgi:four helix bundle protein